MADLTNLAQALSVGSITVGAAGLTLSQFSAGVMGLAGTLRVSNLVNAISGFQVNGTSLASTHLSDSAGLARLASPAFTGTPTGVTPAADDNSTKLATTAYVISQGSSSTPAMDGAATIGSSSRWAHADHVHPTDTSRAPLVSPGFSGTPTAPTPAGGDNSTKLATTAFVAALVVPPGGIISYGGAAAPTGWLLCDGSSYATATYPNLFAAIGYAYGGSGANFTVPDLRGRIPVGKNAGTFATLGATGGSETHTLTNAEIPIHNHGGTSGATSAGTPAGSITVNPSGVITTGTESNDHSHSGTTSLTGAHTHTVNVVGSGGALSEDRVTISTTGAQSTPYTDVAFTVLAGDHQHTMTTGGRSAAHTHDVPTHGHTGSFNGTAMGTHTHSISNDGGGGSHSILQPYQVVNYIIKT